MSLFALLAASGLTFFALTISRYHKIGLEKDILIGVVRATIQLTLVGYILTFIFSLNDWKFTMTMISVMIIVAGVNAAKRGKTIKGVLPLVILSIATGALITLFVLIWAGAITFQPMKAIPISGMLIGNAMIACGLTLTRIKEDMKQRQKEVITALSMGATPRQAVSGILRNAIKTGMVPTIDGMKTLGIVQLPGMMTGLILAGAQPLEAIRYQIMVTFMMSSTTAIACTVMALLVYGKFFNKSHQLVFDYFIAK